MKVSSVIALSFAALAAANPMFEHLDSKFLFLQQNLGYRNEGTNKLATERACSSQAISYCQQACPNVAYNACKSCTNPSCEVNCVRARKAACEKCCASSCKTTC